MRLLGSAVPAPSSLCWDLCGHRFRTASASILRYSVALEIPKSRAT